jgi:hypothetical protein
VVALATEAAIGHHGGRLGGVTVLIAHDTLMTGQATSNLRSLIPRILVVRYSVTLYVLSSDYVASHAISAVPALHMLLSFEIKSLPRVIGAQILREMSLVTTLAVAGQNLIGNELLRTYFLTLITFRFFLTTSHIRNYSSVIAREVRILIQ